MRTNKKTIITAVAKRTGLSQANTKIAIQGFLDEVKIQYREGATIDLRGFGTFFPYKVQPRTYNVPKLGTIYNSPKRKVLKFKSSKQNYIYEE